MRPPKVTVRGKKAIVTWKAAKGNGAPLTAYRVDLKKSKKKDKVLAAGVRRTVLKKLPPGRYRVRVAADNDVGAGRFSVWTKFRIRR
jgi:hypothetical protein